MIQPYWNNQRTLKNTLGNVLTNINKVKKALKRQTAAADL
jgi:hypothetical protein